MNGTFDWSEVWRVVGTGVGMVSLILTGLAAVLWMAAQVICKIEKMLGKREEKG